MVGNTAVTQCTCIHGYITSDVVINEWASHYCLMTSYMKEANLAVNVVLLLILFYRR
jgi:hypothetical protein